MATPTRPLYPFPPLMVGTPFEDGARCRAARATLDLWLVASGQQVRHSADMAINRKAVAMPAALVGIGLCAVSLVAVAAYVMLLWFPVL